MNFTKVAMPSTVYVIIDPENVFEENVRKYNIDTETAYTFLGLNQTHLNEGYIIRASDERVKFTLAHEFGHEGCVCRSEDKANQIAHVLVGY